LKKSYKLYRRKANQSKPNREKNKKDKKFLQEKEPNLHKKDMKLKKSMSDKEKYSSSTGLKLNQRRIHLNKQKHMYQRIKAKEMNKLYSKKNYSSNKLSTG
jgi:hypothetical protein